MQDNKACSIPCVLLQALAAEGMPLAEARRRIGQVNAQARAIIGECLEAVSHELTFFPLPGDLQ